MPEAAPPWIGSHLGPSGRMAKNTPSIRKLLKIVANDPFAKAVRSGSVLAHPGFSMASGAHDRARSVTAKPGAGARTGISFGPGHVQ
jgi:hypothetical protein